MQFLRSKFLLFAALLLAIILQVLTPFLHAHTGRSSQFGLHLHVVSTGFESPNSSEVGKVYLTSATEESPEVGVPTSLQSEKFDLIILSFYALVFFILIYSASSGRQIYFFSVDRFAYQRYAQSSLPLSLAPPLAL
ncbi:MAG: hypothetical protein B7Y05_09340 [Polynucleobacter sp. 24-46-87]|jgi:hypothetical protein|nr:MAG: hypothetical protein B7Y05_09340 [Polynucleobacter sp. 24-46-87]OZB48651.1 MAG: hypothetical protein B7X60_03475 [Polynucleobacter sp. 39-45-136]